MWRSSCEPNDGHCGLACLRDMGTAQCGGQADKKRQAKIDSLETGRNSDVFDAVFLIHAIMEETAS